MMTGRTIKVYLANGIPDGLRTAEIMNWTGKMLVFPQVQLVDFLKRPEAKRTGVYLLVGDDPNNATKEQVYIGESDDVHARLKQHAGDQAKDFWSRTVVIVSKDENLSKAHVRYLENRLIALTKQANRATLVNGNQGAPVTLSESDIADMEFFLTQIQMLLPTLGFPFTQPVPTIAPPPNGTGTGSPTLPQEALSLTMTVGTDTAEAISVNSEFIVLKGSPARAATSSKIGSTYRQRRETLRQGGELADTARPDTWVFAQDVSFDSPSAAAAVIVGSNINGRVAWRIKDTQQTYKDWQTAQMNAAGLAPADTTTTDPIAQPLPASESGATTM